ncbi:MAG: hypothetical protein ACE37F_24365 [Nannocystaceae bacterium]|nr:hypothetical protein [bacterium]
MTCTRGHIDNLYFVRWIKPEVQDAVNIMDDVRALRAQRQEDLHYFAIIGPDVDPPGDDVRASMKDTVDDLLQHCATVHLVIEGKGFRRAMARSIGTGIFLLSKNRGRTFAHDSIDDALSRAGLRARQVSAVLDEAGRKGLLNEPQT